MILYCKSSYKAAKPQRIILCVPADRDTGEALSKG